MATGATIGKLGKPVKGIQTQLRGYSILEIIDMFEDERYAEFLKFVDSRVNRSTNQRYYYRANMRACKISNVGSFLARIKDYAMYEQYFASGISRFDYPLHTRVTDVPKGLLHLCREYGIRLSENLIQDYSQEPDLFNVVIQEEYYSMSKSEALSLIHPLRTSYYNSLTRQLEQKKQFVKFVKDRNYRAKALAHYIDDLMTYEAMEGVNHIMSELDDYYNMMSKISPKFDKYPRNFLTTMRIASRNYNRLKEHFDEEAFKRVRDEKMEWKNGDFEFIYPKSTQDIKDEAVQQHNCVASYIQKVLDGYCHILFMRKKDDREKSLVTIEVRDNKVVQARGPYNRRCYAKEEAIIEKYNKHLERINKNDRKGNNPEAA